MDLKVFTITYEEERVYVKPKEGLVPRATFNKERLIAFDWD